MDDLTSKLAVLLPAITADERAGYAAAVAGARGWAQIARDTVGLREHRAQAVAAVRAWPPQQRRGAALRLHADAVSSGVPCYYQRDPIAVLAEHGLPGTRDDLVWSLHLLADEWGLDDGRVYRLPATIAAGLARAELDDLAPALQAVLDYLCRARVPTAIRRDLLRLFGTGIEAATGCAIPPHLLHNGDAFGAVVRQDLAWMLTGPPARQVLLHAASLAKPVPSASWRARAQAMPTDAGWAILDLFIAHDACLHPDTDLLLRGLLWMVAGESSDISDEVTALLGRVAIAGASVHRNCGSVRAPLTAAAAVDILAMQSERSQAIVKAREAGLGGA